MDLLDRIYQDIEIIFKDDQKRLNHILGVRNLALYLADKYNQDEYQCEVAALLHDICKNMSLDQQKQLILPHEVELIESDVLYHAYAAANYAREVYQIDDEVILSAIRSHVYGNMDMSMIDKIIVLSDFCEENRVYKSCEITRDILLSGNFNAALSLALKLTIDSLERRGLDPTNTQVEICRKYVECEEWNY